MTFVIIGGGIDLSVGAIVALAGVWCTTVATQSYGAGGMIFTALVRRASASAWSTACSSRTGGWCRSSRRSRCWWRPAAWRPRSPTSRPRSRRASSSTASRRAASSASRTWSASWRAVGAAGWVLLNRTTFGRRTVAVGGNPEAARLAGINVRRHTMLLYALSGLCCGIAAIMLTAQANSAQAAMANLYELDAIAAAIIGGTLLSGGRGTIVGSLLGVIIFATITNLFAINGLSHRGPEHGQGRHHRRRRPGPAVPVQVGHPASSPETRSPPRPDHRTTPPGDRPSDGRRVAYTQTHFTDPGSGGRHDPARPGTPAVPPRRRRARRRRPARRVHQQRAGAPTPRPRPTATPTPNGNDAPGKKVVIGFSAPAADHGWIAAITNNAKAQAETYSDVEFKTVEAGADAAAQRAALATLIVAEARRDRAAAARRQGAQRVRPRGDGGRHPGRQPRPGVPGRAGLPPADQGRQLRHGRRRRQLHRARSSRPRASATRSSARSPAWTSSS